MHKVIELSDYFEDSCLSIKIRVDSDGVILNIEDCEWYFSNEDYDTFRKHLTKAASERKNV